MSDLLPCPYCEGQAERDSSDDGPATWVVCTACGATAPTVEAWNRRAPSAAFRAGAAEMRERAAGLCEVPQWLKDVIPHVPATPAERAEYETRTNTARAIKAAIRALPLPAAPEPQPQGGIYGVTAFPATMSQGDVEGIQQMLKDAAPEEGG